MPQVTITIGHGRTPEQLRTLIHEVHAAVLRSVNTRPEHIRVFVHEVPRTHWATGDVTLAEMFPHPTPVEPVEPSEREPS
ncbi:tautomerase family protein [Streptomyces sp. NBC_01003]|uniref:tautomerase family protein n=1 Tax=Streptomyces sp. NBC_01003 TaxID=2903714 RepID=UPI003864484A|nr:tautomerase family protein [Streptomyces sp. NBC_01003]